MEKYKLPRSGNAPLVIEGEKIAEEEGRHYAGQDQNRYHNLTLYRTSKEQYVLQILYCTQWQGESNQERVEVFPAIRDVVLFLQRFDPLLYLQGFPLGAQFSERQRRLEQSLRVRFHQQVRDLLMNIDGAEEIEEPVSAPGWLNHLNEIRHEVERRRQAGSLPGAVRILDLLAAIEAELAD